MALASQHAPHTVAVDAPFSDGAGGRVCVDAVIRGRVAVPGDVVHGDGAAAAPECTMQGTPGGVTWVKLTARAPSAVHRVAAGDCHPGARSIVEVTAAMCRAARQHVVDFAAPRVAVVCTAGVHSCVADALTGYGAEVVGMVLPCTDPDCGVAPAASASGDGPGDIAPRPLDRPDRPDRPTPGSATMAAAGMPGADAGTAAIAADAAAAGTAATGATPETAGLLGAEHDATLVNLDVSSMICLVSELTNAALGLEDPPFADRATQAMAEAERRQPVLPGLVAALAGRRLGASEPAIRAFEAIVGTIGGPHERRRAAELLRQVERLGNLGSQRCANLRLTARIKCGPRDVFGVGDRLQITTVSANTGFVRAAAAQGVPLAVMLHESRALTETARRVAEPAADGHKIRDVS